MRYLQAYWKFNHLYIAIDAFTEEFSFTGLIRKASSLKKKNRDVEMLFLDCSFKLVPCYPPSSCKSRGHVRTKVLETLQLAVPQPTQVQ